MKLFLFNLVLASCSLFVFSITVDAHPHKQGEMHHGPSLESYQIELDFSANRLVQRGSTSNIKIAGKDKTDKTVTEKKPDKNKTIKKNQQQKKQQQKHKK